MSQEGPEIDRYNLTTSNYAVRSDSDEEFDLFSTLIGDDTDMVDKISVNMCESEIYGIILELDDTAKG